MSEWLQALLVGGGLGAGISTYAYWMGVWTERRRASRQRRREAVPQILRSVHIRWDESWVKIALPRELPPYPEARDG